MGIRASDGRQVGLRQCPFLDVAVSRSGVTGPVHLGSMEEAVQAQGSPITVERPDLCRTRLVFGLSRLGRSIVMDVVSLSALAAEQVAAAHASSTGRCARTIHGRQTHALRQTVLALVAGRTLGEHESPGEATLQVLAGRVRLSAGGESWEAATGDYLDIPPARHDLAAIEDCAVLLSVVSTARG
ncbi:cupin domain-containing protein [Paractinoplanes rishiriensis]|uniref:Cupin 2 conserved barrel domain-containing protein n=1 Tax=Paractinoplanes rishiriensis TaxID=1050105 RepID=A0A919MVK7_9ACTN|nr:cupin domain-containing protein [Actinoplanes rishiriensis]GIF01527.1 hypothetical protein Ari01nite_89910 [Actinoplanes rishiriensis]